jgi:hypothetical protein
MHKGGKWKLPGPDGLPQKFYVAVWNIIADPKGRAV